MDEKSRQLLNAFTGDLRRWQETLQHKLELLGQALIRLGQEKCNQMDKTAPNKKLIGRVEAVRLQVQVQLSRIGKDLSDSRSRGYDHVVKRYRSCMKSFTEVCRQADMLLSLSAMKDSYADILPKHNKQFVSRIRYEFQQTPKQSKFSLNEYFTTGSESSKQRYAVDTFNMKVHRQLTSSSIKNTQERYQVQKRLMQSRTKERDLMGEKEQQKRWFKGIAKIANLSTNKTKRSSPRRAQSPQPYVKREQSFRTVEENTREDIKFLKSELSSVKLLLSTLAKELDTHSHTQLMTEMKKLKSNYYKMNSNIDDLHSQNQRLLENIHDLSKQLRKERKKFMQGIQGMPLSRNNQYRSQSYLPKGKRSYDC